MPNPASEETTDGDLEGAAPSTGGESEDSFLLAAADAAGMSEGGGRLGPALCPGAIVAKRYRLDEKLGEGGMGVVWAATHRVTGHAVALKFLKGSRAGRDDQVLRFLREARTAAAVDHPNVVRVVDLFELDDRTPVMVMERLRGETLGRRLTREKVLSLAETAALLLPVVSAVRAAHAAGVVHRDLKPENIFVVESAETGPGGETGPGASETGARVKVLDFGVARFADPGSELREAGDGDGAFATESGALLGTAAYMAPEQALAEKGVDRPADVWALGVILYECLAGRRPLAGSSVGQVVAELMSRGIEPLALAAPAVPQQVARLVDGMLTRDPRARPTLDAVADVLERVGAGALEGGGGARVSPGARPRLLTLAVAAAAGTALLTAAIVGVSRRRLEAPVVPPAMTAVRVAPRAPPEAAHSPPFLEPPSPAVSALPATATASAASTTATAIALATAAKSGKRSALPRRASPPGSPPAGNLHSPPPVRKGLVDGVPF
jgi:hypothetical protein